VSKDEAVGVKYLHLRVQSDHQYLSSLEHFETHTMQNLAFN